MAGRYKRPVQYRRVKAGQPEPSPHLGTAWERHHIYEDLTESSSARPGGSQQLEIPPHLNSKRAACFFQFFSPGTGILTPARIYRPPVFLWSARILWIRLIFCKVQGFCKSTWFFVKRKDFLNPSDFQQKARISQIRLIFSKSKVFLNPPDLSQLQILVCILVFDFLHLICTIVIGKIVLTFRFKIDNVVMSVWSNMIIINFVLTL